MPLFGGIEAGGTKFVCAVGSGPEDIRAETRFPTTSPVETLRNAANFFQSFMVENKIRLDGIGIGAFGPVDLHPESPDFGTIMSTPKTGWELTDIRGFIAAATSIPVV